WFFGLTFLFVLLLYFPVLTTFFTGDDFFHFKVAQTDGSVLGFVKLFGFYSFDERGYAFYRPIFREALYHVFYNLFGLNHLPFRLLQFLIHFINVYLVFIVFEKLFKNKTLAYFTSFFFGISAANVGSLYYLAGGVQAQGALMFTLFSLVSFINKKKIATFVFFLLALSSHELTIGLPLLLAGTIFLEESKFKTFITRCIKELWYYGIVLLGFLYLNLFVIGFSSGEAQYKINFNPKTMLNTLSWYGAWALGVPEMLVDYLGSGLKLNPELMKNWGEYFKLIFPAFFAIISIIFYSLVRNIKIFKQKVFWFLIAWFIVGLLPVAFLPIHKKTYYLQISLPAISALIAYTSRRLLVVVVLAFLVLNITSIKLAEKSYWAKQRGEFAQKLLIDFKQKYPTLPKGSRIYVLNDPDYPFISEEWGGTSRQAYFILNGSDALQLLYKDSLLRVCYQDIPKDCSFENSIEFVARL
ncbi:MAG: hypothetical protein AAB546_04240, partial [Patescibacteria group bacterium]